MTTTANVTDRDYFDALFAGLAQDFAELGGTSRFAKPLSFEASVTLIVQWLVTYRPDIETVRFRRDSKKFGRRVAFLDNAGVPLPRTYQPADVVTAHLTRGWWNELADVGTGVEVSAKGRVRAFTVSFETLVEVARLLSAD